MANVARKRFVDAEGNETRSPTPTTVELRFYFADETVRKFQASDFPDAVRAAAEWHGFAQKLGDSYSGAEGDTAYAIEQLDRVAGQLLQGDWVTQGGGAPGITDLARALAEAANVTPEAAQENIAEMTGDQKKKLRKHPRIAPVLHRIKAEKAQERAKRAEAKAGEADAPDLGTLFADDEDEGEEA